MPELTALQEEVVQEAKQRLKKEFDHDQICLDELPGDKEIQENREDAVDQLVIDTCYWDNLGPFALPSH